MNIRERRSVRERLWVDFPLICRHLSFGLAPALTDGLYLANWRPTAVVAGALATAFGLLAGMLHPGFSVVVVESVPLTAAIVVLGVLGGHPGTLFLAAFILGDLLIGQDWTQPEGLFAQLFRFRVPLLIQYGLLAVVLLRLGVWSKAIASLLPMPTALSLRIQTTVGAAAVAAVTFVMIYGWCQMAPIMVQPVFTWSGRQTPAAALEAVQDAGTWIATLAAMVAFARVAIQGWLASDDERCTTMRQLEQQLATADPVRPATDRIPLAAMVAMRSALAALMLGALYSGWLDAIAAVTAFGILLAIREDLLPVLGPWRTWVERWPVLMRMIAATLVLAVIAPPLLEFLTRSMDGYRPVLGLTIVSVSLYLVLLPGPGGRAAARTEAPA